MSRSLLLASLALLAITALAPAASAATSLTLGGLPTAPFESSDTQAVVPFTVALSASQFVCLPGPAVVVVTLAAVASGTGVNGTIAAAVTPSELTFTIPAGQGLATAFSSDPQSAVVTLRPSNVTGEITDNITVTATATASGCQPTTEAPAAVSQAFTANFGSVPGSMATTASEIVPGLELPLLLGVLGFALVVLRRKQ